MLECVMPSASWQSVNTSEIIIQVFSCQVADLPVPETLFWNFQILWFPGIHEEFVPGLPPNTEISSRVTYRNGDTVCLGTTGYPQIQPTAVRNPCGAPADTGYRAECNSRSGCFVFPKELTAKNRNHFMTSNHSLNKLVEIYWKVNFSWLMCDLFFVCVMDFPNEGNQGPRISERKLPYANSL